MNEIITIREVRTTREKLCDEIAALVSDFKKRAKGIRISGINITRAAKKDRRGIGYHGLFGDRGGYSQRWRWKWRIMTNRDSKIVTNLDQLPAGEHWVILTNRSPGALATAIQLPPKTGQSIDRYLEYEAFSSEESFKIELERRLKNRFTTVCGIHVSGIYVPSTTVTFTENSGR